MIYNDKLISRYGNFYGIVGSSPNPTKPFPSKQNYDAGNFVRVFVKKINEDRIFEIDGTQTQNINKNLYQLVFVTWTISGPKENTYKNGIITPGVYNQNMFEIERVMKEDGVDLKKVLSNPLEYWRGH